MIISKSVVLVLLLIGCHQAASQPGIQPVRCYSGERCRQNNQLHQHLLTPDGCCSSFPNTLKAYSPTGSEECVSCGSYTYRCFVAECDDTDLMINIPDSENTTFIMNDGERVCCSSGQYRSWMSEGTCNLCPVPATTVNIPKLTTTTKTTLPEATNGQGVKTDSESRPQNPTSNNGNVENQSSGAGRSQHYIAGTVITTITLAILALI